MTTAGTTAAGAMNRTGRPAGVVVGGGPAVGSAIEPRRGTDPATAARLTATLQTSLAVCAPAASADENTW
ncbi:hypothetical protein [Streptomyces chattanoogensis]|uniref:hypothetical protein n=1 Tax=Streptomyces chattanoogensis TaxID=66876 RepID=UPI0036B8F3A7